MALQWGIPVENITHHLSDITCCPNWDKGTLVKSVPDGIARVLANSSTHTHIHEYGSIMHPVYESINGNGSLKNSCLECGASLIYSEGCMSCPACGGGKCD